MTPNNIVVGYRRFERIRRLPSHRRGKYLRYIISEPTKPQTTITTNLNLRTNNPCLSSLLACCIRYVTKICNELEPNGTHKLLMSVGNIYLANKDMSFREE